MRLEMLPFKSLTAFALATSLMGCNGVTRSQTASSAGEERPLVVATTSVLCDMTQQVAGQTIDLKCLVEPGVDPHLYQPKPEDRKAIESAKLIFYAGYEFDPSLIKLVQATSNPAPKVAVHEVAVPQPLMGEAHEHEAEKGHQHHKGEKHAAAETAPDPHVWHDAQNGIRMIETVRSHLAKLSPSNTPLYTNNSQKIAGELQQIDTWIKSQIDTIPPAQRKLVTTHDALGYYVKAYGLSFEGALSGFSTEEEPAAARVGELVKEIKIAGVPTIFAETTTNSKLIEAVAKEAKVKVSDQELFVDSLGEKGTAGDTYQKMLMANTRAIVEGLGGQYAPFQP